MISARIAQIVDCTEAEGPGRRLAIWFQGCPLRCPGCCNPDNLAFEGGEEISLKSVHQRMKDARDNSAIEGISLLGGEPVAHASAAAEIASTAHQLGLSVMVYSGYTLPQLRDMAEKAVATLLSHVDVLVDGPYIRELPETRRRWIGSTNQQVHLLTDRYSASDPCWTQSNTLEIRLRGGDVEVNGFPARSAIGLWRRPLHIEAS